MVYLIVSQEAVDAEVLAGRPFGAVGQVKLRLVVNIWLDVLLLHLLTELEQEVGTVGQVSIIRGLVTVRVATVWTQHWTIHH